MSFQCSRNPFKDSYCRVRMQIPSEW